MKALVGVRLTLTLLILGGACLFASAARAEPAYAIVSETAQGDHAALAVRLPARLGDQDLKSLGDAIRLRRSAGKSPVSALSFYLPGEALSGPPWAEVRFQPATSVAILGLRREEEDAYRALAARDARNVVGVWLTSPPALGGMLTIYRDADRRVFAEWRLRNGQMSTDELSEWGGNRGRRFTVIGGEGGFFQALWNGQLELGAGGRVLAVAERLAFERRIEKPAAIAGGSTAPAAAFKPTPSPKHAAVAATQTPPNFTKPARRKPKRGQTVSDLTRAAIGSF